jgi:serine/threonine protein kinase
VSQSTLLQGTLFQGRYQIQRAIRSGGMGEVYRATDKETGMIVAVKRMLVEAPEGADDGARYHQQRFEEECKILKNLSFPGIPKFVDSFQDGDRSVIVMEFIEGVDLEKQVMDQVGLAGENLPVALAVEYTIQVAKILEYLHAYRPRPIVHRDVKPANIIVRHSDNMLYLVDFGLAREVGGGTSTRTAVGTVGYAPMEQYRGRPTTRTDQYSLGVTLHFMLSGQQPLPLQVEPLDKLRRDLPHELCWIVRQATQAEQEDRFESVYEFRRKLQEVLPKLETMQREQVLKEQARDRLTLLGPTEELAEQKPAQRVKLEGIHVPAPDPLEGFGTTDPLANSRTREREFQLQAAKAERDTRNAITNELEELQRNTPGARNFPVLALLALALGLMVLYWLNRTDQRKIAARIVPATTDVLGYAGLYWDDGQGGIGRSEQDWLRFILSHPLPRHDGVWFTTHGQGINLRCHSGKFPNKKVEMALTFLNAARVPVQSYYIRADRAGLKAAPLRLPPGKTVDFSTVIAPPGGAAWLAQGPQTLALSPRSKSADSALLMVLEGSQSGITLDLKMDE